MFDKYGLSFNLLQGLGLYLYYLGYKNKKESYKFYISNIYVISIMLNIVRYSIITFLLFIFQVFALLIYPYKE